MSFLLLLLIIQYLFFSLGGGWSVQGAMLIWPKIVCGSTVYHLVHLVVHVFPSRLGTGIWWSAGALLVSLFNMKWRCYAQAGGVVESVLPLLGGFSCKMYLQHLSKILL
jgi:hypothetical protein